MALEPTRETIVSALGPKGGAIEDMALRLVAVLEQTDDLQVTARAWVIADQIYAARLAAKRVTTST